MTDSDPGVLVREYMGRLQGQTAIITGASRGIGASVAKRFAREGAAVVVNHPPDAHMAELAADVVSEIERTGGQALAVAGDVREAADVASMVRSAEERFGDVTILVANAAASSRHAWHDIGSETWDHTFAVNVRGAFLCAQAVHGMMLRQGGGSIITVSSIMAHLGMVGALDYVSSKAALIGFTRALAREIGDHNIRVNCVMPGAIRTEQELELDQTEEELADLILPQQSLPRRGFAADLDGTFVFLASDDSAFVTGQVLAVDGGWVNR